MNRSSIRPYCVKQVSPPPQNENRARHHAFVIVGSGPVGLVTALEMARKGHQVTLVSAFDFIPHGSKAICFAKQPLDIFNRLGIGESVLRRGVSWNVGKLFWQDQRDAIYQFDMLPVKDQKSPAFINLQQYYLEEILVDALEAMENVDLRWGHKVTDINFGECGAALNISTTQGDYELTTDFVIACDGSKSTIRTQLKLNFEGRVFEDNFLIADIRFSGRDAQDRAPERWFWFDPPFCPGGTALLHKQPDQVWRCDFQLGANIDRDEAIKPDNVEPLITGMFGDNTEFEKVWYSVYTFQCRRMERFVHGPVIFAGDSAHLVSPFGARGANSGIADAENLAWKLDFVLREKAPLSLLETFNYERVMAADENILNSSRSTDFMSPINDASRAYRDAVLELASEHEFARPFINSGRLSTATPYHESPLSTADRDEWRAGPPPGYPCLDAPLEKHRHYDWLLGALGDDFKVVHFGDEPPNTELECVLVPSDSEAADRYGTNGGGTYLVRPDQIVAARWKTAIEQDIIEAHLKAIGA